MDEFENIKYKIYLKDIKSIFIMKKIFWILPKKQILNMIIYNKELKKILLVDIKDYKEISGKYKIGKKNGEGKEYNYDRKLIYEGEYLNGKRNGKGKEYYIDDILNFEQENLNAVINRKGKEYYYKNGNIKFEGKYLDGKRWNGKGYNI